MTDRELLEAAAKAAGIKLRIWQDGMQLGFLLEDERRLWNPLSDDGDALRLAVRREIEIRVFNGKAHAGRQDEFWRTESWFPDGDVYAATRRAIVRAAAALAVSDLAKMEGAK